MDTVPMGSAGKKKKKKKNYGRKEENVWNQSTRTYANVSPIARLGVVRYSTTRSPSSFHTAITGEHFTTPPTQKKTKLFLILALVLIHSMVVARYTYIYRWIDTQNTDDRDRLLF